ncbi:MAG: 3-oxoacyl-[acyl-carrier-protein] synthase III C-terminal domain-containing protein [Pseudomonadota bacterium]
MKFGQPIPLCISGTASIGPGRHVPTEAVVAAAYGVEDAEKFAQRVETIKRKTGINRRYYAGPDDTCASVGTEALRQALATSGLRGEQLERLIFVSSGGGDLVFPATANLICQALDIADTSDCFDINNACTGFLTALEIAACGIAVGSGPVGIVVAEFASRNTSPTDPRPYLVFGDAVAAAVVEPATSGGILASYLRNDGITFGNVRMRNAVITGTTEKIQFTDANSLIESQALEALAKCIDVVLEDAGLSLDAMDWVLPHQPNGILFDKIINEFKIPPAKVIPVAVDIGSTGAAAMPYSLDQLYRRREVRSGQKILLAGVGAGVSYGAMIYEVP